mmetsp:Transcript_7597/g.11280  ORF Transcript_7597/g.11280 Transcript_7597/m.11280 type:complete len:175 (+) Transcript_7597:19-543(+)
MESWKRFPLDHCNGIPISKNHPGRFGAIRKHDIHTGVDLYCEENDVVYAVESGIVINVEDFTGPKAGSDWWLDTEAVLVKGPSGMICYGELKSLVKKGDTIKSGDQLGLIRPVLKTHKKRDDIPGHSRCMLHIELYEDKAIESVEWPLSSSMPSTLKDITPFLLKHRPSKLPLL